MDLFFDFFIHGVPNGFNYVGLNEERNFFSEKFYTKALTEKDAQCFYIQTKETGRTKYCFYHYFVYKSPNGESIVDASNGRSVLYFAISLRFNCYVQNYNLVYSILDYAYQQYVIGTILELKNGKLRYKENSFKESDRKKIEDAILKMLQEGTMVLDSLNAVPVISQQYSELNQKEAAVELVADCIKQKGAVLLSNSSDSKEVRELRQQLENSKNKLTGITNATKNKDVEVESLKQQIKGMKAELEASKVELQNVKADRSTAAVAESLIDPLAKTLDACISIIKKSSPKEDKRNVFKRIWDKVLLVLIAIMSAIALGVMFFRLPSSPSSERAAPTKFDKKDQTEEKIVDKNYDLVAKNDPKGKQVDWTFTNCTSRGKSGTMGEVQIRPNRAGEVKITCQIKGDESSKVEKCVSAKKTQLPASDPASRPDAPEKKQVKSEEKSEKGEDKKTLSETEKVEAGMLISIIPDTQGKALRKGGTYTATATDTAEWSFTNCEEVSMRGKSVTFTPNGNGNVIVSCTSLHDSKRKASITRNVTVE